MKWIVAPWRFVLLHLWRACTWDLRSLSLTEQELTRLHQRGITDLATCQYLVWRRGTLLVASLATSVYAVGHAVVALDFYREAPLLWTTLGLIVQTIRYATLFVLPGSSLAAFALWDRPRISRSIMFWGWVSTFVVPLLLVLVPAHWLIDVNYILANFEDNVSLVLQEVLRNPTVTISANETMAGLLEGLIDSVGGLVLGALLLPTVLSIAPGAFRACLRLKVWLPESILPGWTLLTIAPLYAFALMIFFMMLIQVTNNGLVLVGTVLFALAPLAYVIRAPLLLRPVSAQAAPRLFHSMQYTYGALIGSAVFLLGVYFFTWEIHLGNKVIRLIGLSEDCLLAPWDPLQPFVEYFGRSLFVTVVIADLILRAHLLVWSSSRSFAGSAEAPGYDARMDRLSKLFTRRVSPSLPPVSTASSSDTHRAQSHPSSSP